MLANLLDLFGKVPSLRGPHKNHMLACGAWVGGVTFPKVLPLQLFWLGFEFIWKRPPLKGPRTNHILARGVWIRGVAFPKCYLGNCFGYTFEFIVENPLPERSSPKSRVGL